MTFIEKYYGMTFRTLLWMINPFKKIVIKTEAKVHKFINQKALNLLKEHHYEKEYKILKMYTKSFNEGAVWADQDFKSISHFYNPTKKRGLYGHGNALELTSKYYRQALEYWHKKRIHKAVFYLGACVHIIQDLTIPQHVNIRLLDNHRQYENFVKMTYNIVNEFSTNQKPIEFDELQYYIRFNVKVALKAYKKFKKIQEAKQRFYKITLCALPLAQRTTAGCILMFLKDVGFSTRE